MAEFRVKTPTVVLLATSQEMAKHCRVDDPDELPYLEELTRAAMARIVLFLRRELLETVYETYLDCWPIKDGGRIPIPRPPCVSVDKVEYRRTSDGAWTELVSTEYDVDTVSEPARLLPAYGKTWPPARAQANAIRITHTAGYGAAPSAVPADIRHAAKLTVAHWNEHREAVAMGGSPREIPETAKALLRPHRIFSRYVAEFRE